MMNFLALLGNKTPEKPAYIRGMALSLSLSVLIVFGTLVLLSSYHLGLKVGMLLIVALMSLMIFSNVLYRASVNEIFRRHKNELEKRNIKSSSELHNFFDKNNTAENIDEVSNDEIFQNVFFWKIMHIATWRSWVGLMILIFLFSLVWAAYGYLS